MPHAPDNRGKPPDLWFTEVHEEHYGISLRVKETLFRRQSPYQLVEVLETHAFGRLLSLDGVVQLTERDEFVYHEMLAHVPLCVHREPRDVLLIGGGDGGTVREVLKHPSIRRVDLVEIDEVVVQASREHLPTLNPGLKDSRVKLHFQDGTVFAKGVSGEYDAVLVDSTDPVGTAVPLFQSPFYRDLARALRPDGVLSVQSESPIFNPDVLTHTHARLGSIFPHAAVYTAPVVTYPGTVWSFTFAGKQSGPLGGSCADACRQRGLKTRYYTAAIHQAAFQLPPFVQEFLK